MKAELFSPHLPVQLGTQRGSWIGYAAVLGFLLFAVISPPLALGSKMESRFLPILSHQAIPIDTVSRVGQSLCWTWERDKERAPQVLDLDVALDTADGDTYAPEIVNTDTGVPWHKGGALPPGHYSSRFCTTIPTSVPLDAPVRLRQAITYQGFMGLWTIWVALPPVIAN